MTFVTRLSFQSGDRAALEDVVTTLKTDLERKGVEVKGPHQEQPEELSVPQYRRLAPGDSFDPWRYTVYARWMEIHGAENVARQVVDRAFPDSIYVEVEVAHRRTQGHRG